MGVNIDWGGYNSFFERNNAGEGIMAGYDKGVAERKVQAQENALRQYAMNPNDPAGLNALAQADPRLAIQARQEMARTAATERKTQAELSEASRANVIKGAQIIRQAQPKDQAGWDQVLQMAQAAGIDISTVPRQFDPQFAQNMTNLADTFEPVKTAEPTSMQRDYQFLQGKNPALAETYLRSKAEPAPMIASNGDGTFTIIPRTQVSSAAPATQGAVPPPPAGFMIDGGPTPPASGTFRP